MESDGKEAKGYKEDNWNPLLCSFYGYYRRKRFPKEYRMCRASFSPRTFISLIAKAQA
jgi:1,2-phenylacetyl-CoA epoxidase PaaB subunit